MASNGSSFFDKVLTIVKEEMSENAPLIDFKHPKELESILDLDVSCPATDAQLESSVRQVLHYSVKTYKPTFRNQLYGGTDPYGLAGAWIAEAFNTSQYTFEVAPAFTLIEQRILQHILNLFGIPDGDGIFSPGGSTSMMYAVVAARFRAFPEVKTKGLRGLPEMVIFSSEDSHYSIRKAAHWLGFGTDSVQIINTTPHGKMVTLQLEVAIKKAVDEGKFPLMVNATAGTTVLGAIDDLDEIASVCKKYDVWMHVDACWGGSLILSDKYRILLKGIEYADSISWNPHKMAGAPLQCAAFLVRTRGLLHCANAAAAQYLFQQDKFYDVSYDTGDKSIQCGRKIDAFKLWVMWKARGDVGLRTLVDGAMNAAQCCAAAVCQRRGFRIVAPPICPSVCFWFVPTFMRHADEDERWWGILHLITPKIKELLTLHSKLMVAYSPVRHYKNFFRLSFTCHPVIGEKEVTDMLDAIEECGESLSLGSDGNLVIKG